MSSIAPPTARRKASNWCVLRTAHAQATNLWSTAHVTHPWAPHLPQAVGQLERKAVSLTRVPVRRNPRYSGRRVLLAWLMRAVSHEAKGHSLLCDIRWQAGSGINVACVCEKYGEAMRHRSHNGADRTPFPCKEVRDVLHLCRDEGTPCPTRRCNTLTLSFSGTKEERKYNFTSRLKALWRAGQRQRLYCARALCILQKFILIFFRNAMKASRGLLFGVPKRCLTHLFRQFSNNNFFMLGAAPSHSRQKPR